MKLAGCLLLALLSSWHCANGLFFTSEQSNDGPHLYQLATWEREPFCRQFDQGIRRIHGSMKLTTAVLQDSRRRICDSPLGPFGALIRDPRGMRYWYLRLRITALAPGQKLYVVNVGRKNLQSREVDDDQRYDLTHNSHSYPLTLNMRYRYVRLIWNSSVQASRSNIVNITIAGYARFNDSVNVTMQQTLCELHTKAWCSLGGRGFCVSPDSCSLQDDCFDSFTDPEKCTDIVWIGGNATVTSNRRTWLGRNLQWLALGTIPIVLVFALAKICSQKRDLDIDDDYEYKASDSEEDEEEEEAAAAAAAVGTVRRQSQHDYAYPSSLKEEDEDEEEESGCDSEISQLKAAEAREAGDGKEEEEEEEKKIIDNSEREEAPPPPPPRLAELPGQQQQQQQRQLEEEAEEEDFVNVNSLRHEQRQQQQQHESWCSGDYVACGGVESPVTGYTRLISQPSTATVKELLNPTQAPKSAGGASEADETPVVYTELVVPPPATQQEQQQQQQENSENLELRPLPSGRTSNSNWTDSYDKNYIVV